MKTILVILGVLMLAGGVLYAQGKIERTESGFKLFANKAQAWYENRIIWGEDYFDHDAGNPVHNTEVVVWGEDWLFSTTTDDEGNFRVEVKPDTPFRLKASDGNIWAEYNGTLAGVPKGTTKNDKTTIPIK